MISRSISCMSCHYHSVCRMCLQFNVLVDFENASVPSNYRSVVGKVNADLFHLTFLSSPENQIGHSTTCASPSEATIGVKVKHAPIRLMNIQNPGFLFFEHKVHLKYFGH